MWAGITRDNTSSGSVVVQSSEQSFFACPQQSSLRLAFSRVNDGICDCCDGADENNDGGGSTIRCDDICDEVLAEERAVRAKLKENYEVGSKIRSDSISQYRRWLTDKRDELHNLKDVELVRLEKDRRDLDVQMSDEKMEFSKIWEHVIMEQMADNDALMSLVGATTATAASKSDGTSVHMSVDDLSSLIISLCWLSGESSHDNVANGRCVPFDRASIDVGILWDHPGGGDNDDDNSLPKFHYLDPKSDASLLEYSEKIIAMTKGIDTEEWSSGTNNRKKSSRPTKRREYEDDYDDDEMHHEFFDDELEEEMEDETDATNNPAKHPDDTNEQLSVDQIVQTRLGKLHLSGIRELFKEQANMLLKLMPPAEESEEEEDEGEEDTDEEGSMEASATKEEGKEEAGIIEKGIDPVAVNMAKSIINKRLSGIHRGEASAKFAARHIISLMKNRLPGSRSITNDMQMLAIRIMYHSQISSDDIAEAIYFTSTSFRSDVEVDPSTCVSTSPWNDMCPPRILSIEGSSASFPPDFIVAAAVRLCEERANAMTGVCAAQQGLDVNEFPTTIDEGYYNYYSPKQRQESDLISKAFSSIVPPLVMPFKLSKLIHEVGQLDGQISKLKKEVGTIEGEIDSDTKFGLDGELYILRDSCHSVESGKYEYEVCIFGKAAQRDIGKKEGGTNLGNWQSMQLDESGVRTLKWTGGTKCWNGPQRSAEVVVTCGIDTKLLTADEPETCRYVFTMESPIGCDLGFKLNNSL